MLQTIYEQSTQKYPIGMRIALDDRVFRYCRAGTALRPLIDGMNGNLVSIRGNTDAVEYAAGTSEITIPMNPYSVDHVDEQKADYWKGGLVWILSDPFNPAVSGIGQQYKIKRNAAAVGGFVTLTLEEPLRETVTASREVNASPNTYRKIVGVPSPFVPGEMARYSLVCIPLIPVTLGNYFWGMTWGPLYAHCGIPMGRVENDRQIYWSAAHYGLIPGSAVDFSTLGNPTYQLVGFVLSATTPFTLMDGTPHLGSDNLFMLQLSP